MYRLTSPLLCGSVYRFADLRYDLEQLSVSTPQGNCILEISEDVQIVATSVKSLEDAQLNLCEALNFILERNIERMSEQWVI